ncbi:Hypp7574 [Branchiostoma lanceolatum]|uniref:Hypp7574 protein n=1 Tax=Branchiostoma lanceolatum TaxID=7740 RepID=A0A8K0ECD7_BRALA|nr:Hypp7574 [Branchiostoma lanceolatum]
MDGPEGPSPANMATDACVGAHIDETEMVAFFSLLKSCEKLDRDAQNLFVWSTPHMSVTTRRQQDRHGATRLTSQLLSQNKLEITAQTCLTLQLNLTYRCKQTCQYRTAESGTDRACPGKADTFLTSDNNVPPSDVPPSIQDSPEDPVQTDRLSQASDEYGSPESPHGHGCADVSPASEREQTDNRHGGTGCREEGADNRHGGTGSREVLERDEECTDMGGHGDGPAHTCAAPDQHLEKSGKTSAAPGRTQEHLEELNKTLLAPGQTQEHLPAEEQYEKLYTCLQVARMPGEKMMGQLTGVFR